MIYFATSTPATVDARLLAGRRVLASWLDPRDGSVQQIGEIAAQHHTFEPPQSSAGADWILVLDALL